MFHKSNVPVLAFVLPLAFAQQQLGGTSIWLWLLIIAIVVVIFFFLIRGARKGELGETKKSTMEPLAAAAPPVEETPVMSFSVAPLDLRSEEEPAALEPLIETAPPTPDDLKIIEGIGPKIAGILNSLGIFTFAQLACVEPDELRKMMLDAGLRLADPATWPVQAQLAADGKLDELKTLQDHLKGGREI